MLSTLQRKLYKERMAKFPFSLPDVINKTPIFIKLQPLLGRVQYTTRHDTVRFLLTHRLTVTSTTLWSNLRDRLLPEFHVRK